MVDVEPSIVAWRARLARLGSFRESDLDELESHVRDHLQALGDEGMEPEAAFAAAVARLGDAGALADEFARAKPAVAWRRPLFWMGAGYFATTVGLALLFVSVDVVVWGGARLGLDGTAMQALVWTAMIGGPAVVLPLLAVGSARSVGRPMPWADSRGIRVGALVAAAGLVLFQRVDWVAFHLVGGPFRRSPEFFAALASERTAFGILSIAGPLLMTASVVVLSRRVARSDDAHDASALWFLTGGLFEIASRAFGVLIPNVVVLGGASLHLDRPEMRSLMWSAVIGAPLVAVAAAGWLHGRLPPPRRVRSAAILVVALAISGAAIGCVMFAGRWPAQMRSSIGEGALVDAFDAALLAGLLVAAAATLAAGVAIVRLREAPPERG